MILLIDNYDSFVFNLSRYVEELGYQVQVIRNDALSIEAISYLKPSHIIISPGPCGPEDAGISLEVVHQFAGIIPILGICLGHQVIGHAFGGEVVRAKEPMHGKASLIKHNGQGVFHEIPSPIKVGRYHSLIVSEQKFNKKCKITSRSSQGEIMSLASKKWKIIGLQFHPESVLTEFGHKLIKNFIDGFY